MMGMARSRYLFFVEKAVAVLLLIYPTFMLTIKGGMNGVLLFMLLLAFVVWIVRPIGMSAVAWRPEWTIYAVAMLAMSAAIFISQSYHQNYTAHPHDAASRYWLVIPVFLLLLRLRPNVFSVLQFAFPVAAIMGLLLAKNYEGRWGLSTLDLIHFGDFELILGVLSLFSIGWLCRDKLPMRILKILGFVAGLTASLASGSRGGWLAIPVFVVIFIYFKTARISHRMIAVAMFGAMLSVILLYSFNHNFYQRVNELTSDMAMFNQGKRDTSTGIRWQLYAAAVDVFLQNPVFGAGPGGFAQQMEPMLDAGKVTPIAALFGRGEVHNDILSKSAELGIFGLFAILALYFAPFSLFLQATRSRLRQIRRAGILGVTFVSGFFVFGLTVEILDLTMASAFYSFTVAVLLAACYNIHYSDKSLCIKLEQGRL